MISITKRRLASLASASAIVATMTAAAAVAALAATLPREYVNGFPGGLSGFAGLGTLLAISAVSIGVSGVVRRWQTRRHLRAHVAARLAAFVGPRTVAVAAAGERSGARAMLAGPERLRVQPAWRR